MAFVCQTVPIDLRESPVHRKKRIASTGFRNGDANDYSVFVPGNRLFREIQPMQHTRIFWRFDVLATFDEVQVAEASSCVRCGARLRRVNIAYAMY
jgi:hypothetical protein